MISRASAAATVSWFTRPGTAGCRYAANRAGGSHRSTRVGCVLSGISAIAGYLVPSTGSPLNLAWGNWNTALGAACFLACALATLPRRLAFGETIVLAERSGHEFNVAGWPARSPYRTKGVTTTRPRALQPARKGGR
jgi:hypothetical protein